ncbi:hypothetical protein BaRGS_00025353 [Batillaria attramentaria]|uniref:Uncharacterized protein n=1 Tax=Batillaria attramentaria TaxID=370345 RepID=A0ABD0K8L6_9CAEN
MATPNSVSTKIVTLISRRRRGVLSCNEALVTSCITDTNRSKWATTRSGLNGSVGRASVWITDCTRSRNKRRLQHSARRRLTRTRTWMLCTRTYSGCVTAKTNSVEIIHGGSRIHASHPNQTFEADSCHTERGSRQKAGQDERGQHQERERLPHINSSCFAESLASLGGSATSLQMNSNQSNGSDSAFRNQTVGTANEVLNKISSTLREADTKEKVHETAPGRSETETVRSREHYSAESKFPVRAVTTYCSIENLFTCNVNTETPQQTNPGCSMGHDPASSFPVGGEYAGQEKENVVSDTNTNTCKDCVLEEGQGQAWVTDNMAALCSFRYHRRGVTDLMLSQVCRSPSGGYVVDVISSLTSVGITASEPADNRDDCSEGSSGSVSRCSLSLSGINFTTGSSHFQTDTSEELIPPSVHQSSLSPCSRVFAVMEARLEEGEDGSQTSSPSRVGAGRVPAACNNKDSSALRPDSERSADIATCSQTGIVLQGPGLPAPGAKTERHQNHGRAVHNTHHLTTHKQEEDEVKEVAKWVKRPRSSSPGHVSKPCSSWTSLIAFIQSNKSTCPVFSPPPQHGGGRWRTHRDVGCQVAQQTENSVSPRRAARLPILLELANEENAVNERSIVDTGLVKHHKNQPAHATGIRRDAGLPENTEEVGHQLVKCKRQLFQTSPTRTLHDKLDQDLDRVQEIPTYVMMPRKFSPGRCSDIVQEARPLRAAWQKTRLQEFPPHDGARPRRSSSGDPRQKHETDGEQFEPALARTASSLELEQNLQLAKITAIQNMTSSCPFMPWEGNLDNPPIYLPSEKDGVREVMSECSTTPDKGNEAESRICTPISELSSDEMEEGEQEDTTLKRGVRHVARRDNVSHLSIAKKKASPTILKRPGKRGSAYDADFPAPSVSSRDRSRSPVHDDRRCRVRRSRSPSWSSDVASKCTRSACARRQYCSNSGTRSHNDVQSDASSQERTNAAFDGVYLPTSISSDSFPSSASPGATRTEFTSLQRRVGFAEANSGFFKKKESIACTSDPDSEVERLLFGNSDSELADKEDLNPLVHSPPTARRLLDEAGGVHALSGITNTSALMHNCSNNIDSRSRTSFRLASKNVEHRVYNSPVLDDHTWKPQSPQPQQNSPNDGGNQSGDNSNSPTLPVFSMHTKWHSFVSSSQRNTPRPFTSQNNSPTKTCRRQDISRNANSPLAKPIAVSAFSGVDPTKREMLGNESSSFEQTTNRSSQHKTRGDDNRDVRRSEDSTHSSPYERRRLSDHYRERQRTRRQQVM